MNIQVESDKVAMGRAASAMAADGLKRALAERGEANLILATGASQFEMLDQLVQHDVDWQKVTCFHLDEYVGLPETHPASFRGYLKKRFAERVNGPKEFHWINADGADPDEECRSLDRMIQQHPIDVACVGIGENGHLAFNDPPADFDTEKPYLVVELDEACRRQQLGEGWFPTFDDVPKKAISMSVGQIMKSKCIVCTVPDERKAEAVKNSVEGPVTPNVPASILQRHENTTLFCDTAAASRITTVGK